MDKTTPTESWRGSTARKERELKKEVEVGMAILGAVMIIIGFLALGSLVTTTFTSVFALGSLLAAGGIVQIIFAFRRRKKKGFVFGLLSGILYVVIGAVSILNPLVSVIGLTLLLAALFIVSGIFRLITAATDEKARNRGWMAFRGLLSLILGMIIYLAWPISSFWFLGLFIAIELVSMGISWIVLAYAIEKRKVPLPVAETPLNMCYTTTGKQCPCTC